MFHKQALKQSLVFFKREPLTTVMTVLVIAITLMLSSLFWMGSEALSRLSVEWSQSGHITLYLDISISHADEDELLSRIRATPGVSTVDLKTPTQGLEDLSKQEGMQDIMHYLPDNPLPTVIDVTPESSLNTKDSILNLYETIKSYPHVEQAKMDMEWVDHLFSLFEFLTQMTRVIMLLLALAVVLIIGNTIRLVIHERQDEITVLKLIGAGKSFIMRPFLYSGIWYGLLASMLAVACVNFVIFILDSSISQLFESLGMQYTLALMSIGQMGILMLCATGLGWLGARWSVNESARN